MANKTTALTTTNGGSDVFIADLPSATDDGLSTGAKIGIGIAIGVGSAVTVGAVTYGVVKLVQHNKEKKAAEVQQFNYAPLPQFIAPQQPIIPTPVVQGPQVQTVPVQPQPVPQPAQPAPQPQVPVAPAPVQEAMIPQSEVDRLIAENQKLQQQADAYNRAMQDANAAFAAKDQQINLLNQNLQQMEEINRVNANNASANKIMLDALAQSAIQGGSNQEDLNAILTEALKNAGMSVQYPQPQAPAPVQQ
jgi:hypothetical protein